MDKQVIMVDQDEVLSEGGFLILLNEYLQTDYKSTDFKTQRMQSIIPLEERPAFFEWFKKRNMYDYVTLVPGAYEGLKELNEYYDINIATAYIFPEAPHISGKFLQEKYDFLTHNFPFINPNNISFINRKDLFNAYCKIDDKISNLKNAKRKILFPAYHNSHLTKDEIPRDIERVSGWEEITRKLIKK